MSEVKTISVRLSSPLARSAVTMSPTMSSTASRLVSRDRYLLRACPIAGPSSGGSARIASGLSLTLASLKAPFFGRFSFANASMWRGAGRGFG